MGNDQIPEPHELPNKPLVEAIFELRWALKTSPQGQSRDPGFRIALGRYWDRLRKDYPEVQDLPTAQVPEDMTAYAVRHRFRAGPEQWPLTQLGPGILTVNETSGYTWHTFRPRLLAAIKAFSESYPTDICELRPIRLQLRYIDAIPYDPGDHDPCTFLAELLHTRIGIEPELFEDPENPDRPVALNLNLTFPLRTPTGTGILGFATGEREEKPSIIMNTIIRSDGDSLPKKSDEYERWLNDAHAVAVDKWFFTLCRGRLMTTFEESHGNLRL